MPRQQLSFTMRAAMTAGDAPPERGDGPLPHGSVRIPVSLDVVIPPEAAAAIAAAEPGASVSPDQPAATRRHGATVPRSEAGRRVLASLFAAAPDGRGAGGGVSGGGRDPGMSPAPARTGPPAGGPEVLRTAMAAVTRSRKPAGA